MSTTKQCPFCFEQIPVSARKCRYCLEFTHDKGAPATAVTDARFDALLGFAGKLILPVAVLVAALMFKPSIENLATTAESAEFMGLSIKFRETRAFSGDLSPYALYYLIGSADAGGVRYEQQAEIAPINELRDKGLVSLEIERVQIGSPEMRGTWAKLEPTPNGRAFLREIGIQVESATGR